MIYSCYLKNNAYLCAQQTDYKDAYAILPMFRQYHGIIFLSLNPTDGVVLQTGAHRSHYTWWRTQSFEMSNLNMLSI